MSETGQLYLINCHLIQVLNRIREHEGDGEEKERQTTDCALVGGHEVPAD